MWALVTIGVVLVVALGVLVWVRFHRVRLTRLSREEEEAAAAEHSRPLANVTVLRGGGHGRPPGQ
jgi:hypothetical protein